MKTNNLVNPISLGKSFLHCGGENLQKVGLLDLSFLRVVTSNSPVFDGVNEGDSVPVTFELDNFKFTTPLQLRTRSEEWLRFSFEKVLPSAKAYLKSFMSPKRVGESLIEDWRTDQIRHYHGLNESELWFDSNGSLLFTYLDSENSDYQFLFRLQDVKSPPQVGKMLRRDYVELNRLESELPLLALPDREGFERLSECRDIITNFRPVGQLEYHLKQRLLKMVSQTLYSAGKRVETSAAMRRPHL